jgi:protein-disulfide isomerase
MNHRSTRSLLATAAAIFTVATSVADTPSQAELEALRAELEGVKRGQEAIARDVSEIRKLLESLKPPPPVRSIDSVVALGQAPYKGRQDAPLALIEFSDYQCPFCKRHLETTLPQLEKEYIASGKLRYVFRDLPLENIHPQAFKAAEAARCAGEQQKFWEMHDRLFANQDSLSPEQSTAHASAIGLATEPFRTCVAEGRYAEAIRASAAEAHKLGVTSTPALLLGESDGEQIRNVRLLKGALPFEIFKAEIDKMLAPKSGESQPSHTSLGE